MNRRHLADYAPPAISLP